MKYILSLLLFASCVAVFHPNNGQHCFTWADAQGMTHEQCADTRTQCKSQARELLRRNDQYQTLSDCDLR